MIRRTTLLLVVAVLLCTASLAQDLPVAKPEAVGLSTARLQKIDRAVERSIQEGRIAGAVTLVVRRGKIAWYRAQGMSDREAKRPMQPDNIFRICSMTKPITSVAVMMLYEDGYFLLDDPISRFLPEFKNPKVLVKNATGQEELVAAKREITIRDLLRHTSGITYNWQETIGPRYKESNVATGLLQYDGTLDDSVKALAKVPLLYQPGEHWEYGLSIDVLGRLVEVVSGMSLDEFFRTRIFEPLGMCDTYFYIPESAAKRLATAYTYYDGKGLSRFPETPIVEGPFSYSADYPVRGPRKLYSGGAGLTSTATDYAKFCEMLLNGGQLNGKRLLSRKSVELMTRDHLGNINQDVAFGLGFEVKGVKTPLQELGSPEEYGWGGFFYTSFSIDPKEKMIVIFMAQVHPAGDLKLDRQVHALVYQAVID
ncbi:MAG TPA: serine hydrolase domain-containing protein [Candidatus Acidoferrales bacterium]|nr:serine hydrolase domain-containing protein [Candidatus Acidoferrales bacterium]